MVYKPQMNCNTPHNKNQKSPNQLATIAKKLGHYRNQCRQLKCEKDPALNNTNSADNNNNNKNVQTKNLTPTNKFLSKPEQTIQIFRKRRPRPVYPPCETCGKTNHSTKKCDFGGSAANRQAPRNRRPEGQNQVYQRNAQSNSDGNVQAAAQSLN